MVSTLKKNAHRPDLPPIIVKMEPRPVCEVCNQPMAIVKNKTTKKVGIKGNYAVKKVYYACTHKSCQSNINVIVLGQKRKFLCAKSPHSARQCDYDYDVQAEVIRLRWQEKKTYVEIVHHLKINNDIKMDQSAVEPILKIYEYGCAATYREDTIKNIQNKGGIILCVDVMEPMKGREGILAAHDYFSGLPLGSIRMANGKHASYEDFFRTLKQRITDELGVEIFAICSDALPAQRIAIETIFKGKKHILCHYHFYKYVLKPALEMDSHIVTQIRKNLRKQKNIKEFKQLCRAKRKLPTEYQLLFKLLKPLQELINWERKPNDSCFIALLFYRRLHSLKQRFTLLNQKLKDGNAYLPPKARKIVAGINKTLNGALNEFKAEIKEIQSIDRHLRELVDILSSLEESYGIGLKRLLIFRYDLYHYLETHTCGTLEINVLNKICDYIETKNKQLLNYRLIDGAPNTNNFQEYQFKHVKHIIRRTLGNYAAKEYLWSHGERIIFVKPEETVPNIIGIIKNVDQPAIRKVIKEVRRPHEGWRRIIRDNGKWGLILAEIDEFIENLPLQPHERS